MATAKKKTGRKPLAINAKVVEGMARVGASDTEIAAFLRCSVDTITRRFADILDKSRSSMKITLRRLQWAAAKKGDRTMMIWLGKQYLDQSDRAQTEVSGKDGGPVETIIRVVREPFVAPIHDDDDA